MRLVIVTKRGVPIKRDVLLEVLRRAKENGGNLVQAFEELESELDAYADSLVKAPEYGEIAVESQ